MTKYILILLISPRLVRMKLIAPVGDNMYAFRLYRFD